MTLLSGENIPAKQKYDEIMIATLKISLCIPKLTITNPDSDIIETIKEMTSCLQQWIKKSKLKLEVSESMMNVLNSLGSDLEK